MAIFRHQLFQAFKWSAAGEFASRLIQPLVFLILARLLTPEDFGVMAAATMVISFSQVFWEAGMGKALIQRQRDIPEAANVAFWVNVALGIGVASLIFLVAQPLAQHVFNDARVTLVLQVMVVHILLGAVVATHTALLQKEFRFKQLFWVRLLTVALPALASIPMALYGWSYWALVVGALVGQAGQALVLWRVNEWRPAWGFDRRVAREMAGFGLWVGLSGLLGWFYLWADALIVGMYLGAHELGLYRTGNQFVMMLFGVIFAPLLPVLYSHLSEIQADRERLRMTYERVVKVSILVAMPIAFILFAASRPIGKLIFGEAWSGIGLVIGVMALTHGTSWIIGSNGEVYRAIGKPAYETIVMAVSLPIYLIAYLFSIHRGFDAFVWTRFGLAVAATMLHLELARQLVGLAIAPVFRFLIMMAIASSIALPIGLVVPHHVDGVLMQSLVIVSMSMSAIAFLLYILGVGRIVRPLLANGTRWTSV
ncbi:MULTISPECIES: lipopolysaccharide biosynthesis protein [unclassified Thiocapsa]|uniref:lipopolysaccharide biosynthesis protein n=1 Tax=unclassified Thiocapsa TaxID=2641286 RepID=UPI0035B1A36C